MALSQFSKGLGNRCIIVLQVSMAEGTSAVQGVSLQGSWVNLLSIRLPVLAVAVDDPLLACADRLVQHWSSPGARGPKLHAAGPLPLTTHAPFATSQCQEIGQ